MGRRRTKRQANMVFMFYIGVIAVCLIVKFITWLASLPIITWLFVAMGIICLVLVKRHFANLRKKEKCERRRVELERLGNLNALQKMNPNDFEHYIGDLFRQLGYDAEVTKATGDGGKDILIYKASFFAIVECKRYVKSKVSRPHIQKFHSAIIDCNAERGYFITTGEFSAQAISYVTDKPIILINGNRLIKLIEEVSKVDEPFIQIDMILKTT